MKAFVPTYVRDTAHLADRATTDHDALSATAAAATCCTRLALRAHVMVERATQKPKSCGETSPLESRVVSLDLASPHHVQVPLLRQERYDPFVVMGHRSRLACFLLIISWRCADPS